MESPVSNCSLEQDIVAGLSLELDMAEMSREVGIKIEELQKVMEKADQDLQLGSSHQSEDNCAQLKQENIMLKKQYDCTRAEVVLKEKALALETDMHKKEQRKFDEKSKRYEERLRVERYEKAMMQEKIKSLHKRIAELEQSKYLKDQLSKKIHDLEEERNAQAAKIALLEGKEEQQRVALEDLTTKLDRAVTDCDAAVTARDDAIAERGAAVTARDDAIAERRAAVTARDDAIAECAAAVTARDDAIAERGAAVTARDAAKTGCAAAVTARDVATRELIMVKAERDVAQGQLVTVKAERDAVTIELAGTRAERDGSRSAIIITKAERDAAKSELVTVKSERDATKVELTKLKPELDSTKSQLITMTALHNSAIHERNIVIAERDNLNTTCEQLRQSVAELEYQGQQGADVRGRVQEIINGLRRNRHASGSHDINLQYDDNVFHGNSN